MPLADFRVLGGGATDELLVANRDTPAAFSESSRHRGSETTPFEQRIDACAFVFGVTCNYFALEMVSDLKYTKAIPLRFAVN